MTIHKYPLILGFSIQEFFEFQRDLKKSIVDLDEDDNLHVQDFPSIRVYNGHNNEEDYMFILIKNKDVSFGLDNDTFSKFKRDIKGFTPMELL